MKEKILIIEDDFTIQTQLKTLLSGNGYEVFAVTDFSKTIEQLKEAAPHLVILDIKLPGNNGFEICSGIRTFSDIPSKLTEKCICRVHDTFVTFSGLKFLIVNCVIYKGPD